LRGVFGAWRGFLDISYSNNENSRTDRNFHEPVGGWTAAFMSGAYNPFVDPRVAAPAAPGFYEEYVLYQRLILGASRTYQASLKGSGPLLTLPAGDLQLTAGLEG